LFSIFLTSCSLGEHKSGGESTYLYQAEKEYTPSELEHISSSVITTSFREPPFGKLRDLFGNGQKPLKKIGLVIFESEVQPTRSGLSSEDLIYLNESGKQIITEGLHRIWEDSFTLLSPEVEMASRKVLKKSKAFRSYGVKEKDYILSKRSSLAPDDIFYLEAGKNTTTKTVMNSRGMQDLSFLLVPAYELMRGPKFSEHNKHFINDVAKELGLDALVIVKSNLSWSTARIDKHSGESLPEAIQLSLESSVLIPFYDYRKRLEKLGSKDESKVTICYRSYEGKLILPVSFPRQKNEQTFESIQKGLLLPLMKSYADLTQMMIVRLTDDVKKTW
jgi:hypothetical protein